MGRLVFAVPGSPLDPRAAGTNGLLKEGSIAARFVEEPPDFSSTPPPEDNDRQRVVEALGPVPVGVDEIIRHTGLHPAQVFMILLELDLAGRLERHMGGSVSLLVMDP